MSRKPPLPSNFTSSVLLPDGTAAIPALAFSSVPSLGMRHTGTAEIKFGYNAGNGDQLTISDAGQGIYVNRVTCFNVIAGNVLGTDGATYNLGLYGGSAAQSPSVLISSTANQTATAGTQIFCRVGPSLQTGGFAPTSGTAAYRCLDILYDINQTGGANGAITGIYLNSTQTALVGTHKLMDLNVATASKFNIDNTGVVACLAGIMGTITAGNASGATGSLVLKDGTSATVATVSTSGLTMSNFYQGCVNAGLTASTTQTQVGGLALTKEVNEVSTVANANDTVTLVTAVAGRRITIFNNGANTLKIYPASGDNLGAGVDTSTTLAAGSNRTYVAYDATNWEIP